MKITKKHNDGMINFDELNLGDVFCHANCFYLRCTIAYDGDDFYNAVSLITGTLEGFDHDDKVRKIENTELIVEF